MWRLRGQISQLLDHGHPHAEQYPVGRVWDESQLIVDRINRRLATEGTILKAAISTAVAAFGKDGGKSAHRTFDKIIEGLLDNG